MARVPSATHADMTPRPPRGGAGGACAFLVVVAAIALGCASAPKASAKDVPPCLPPDLTACASLDPAHAAVCRTEHYDADAVEHRDVVSHGCIREKLFTMRLLLRDVEAKADGDPWTETRRKNAAVRIDRLSKEATDCGFVCTGAVAGL